MLITIIVVLLLTLSVPERIPMVPSPAYATTINTLPASFAGYSVDYINRTDLTVDGISASWKVPNVRVPLNSTSLEDVAIYGDNDTFITVGTNQKVQPNGTIAYHAFYGNESAFLKIRRLEGKVGPGTSIRAEILKVAGDNWTITISPGTNPADSVILTVPHPQTRRIASWFVEPFSKEWQLANFSSVTFNQANLTVNGVNYRLDDLDNIRFRMYDIDVTCVLADASNISSSRNSFTVNFVRSTPPCPFPAPFNLSIPFLIGGILLAGAVLAVIVAVILSLTRRRYGTGPTPPPPTGPQTKAMMKGGFCGSCGSHLHQAARFCDKCGTQTTTQRV